MLKSGIIFYKNASAQELHDFYASNTPESLQSMIFKINPQTFLDVLFLEIRRETISFSSLKKRERLAQESLLTQEIETLEKQICQDITEENFRLKNNDLKSKKLELEELNAYQAHGALVRARAKYQVDGENHPSSFVLLKNTMPSRNTFLNLKLKRIIKKS